MKSFVSHKIVEAGKIESVSENCPEGWLVLVLEDGQNLSVPDDLPDRYKVVDPVGMYVVRYEDGYLALSPAKAFEDGYSELLQENTETPDDKINAAEALFGFMGMLTSMEHPVTFSARHGAGMGVELVGTFCESNSLQSCRGGWEKNFEYPDSVEYFKSGKDNRKPVKL